MSVIVSGAAKRRGPEENSLHHTLLVLADESDDFGFACPSVEKIARDCRCSTRQIIRRLKRLEQDGWIRIERKVFRGDMANAYFIDVERLGVMPDKQTRRSPLWTNVQRLLKRLEAHDKVSLRNGTLKFERTPESVDLPANGDLFEEEDSASDTMSPENERLEAQNGAKSTLVELILGKRDEIAVEKAAEEAVEVPFSGDKVSRDMCHPRHVTSDIEGKPFNVLTRYSPVLDSSPLPPSPPTEGVLSSIAASSGEPAKGTPTPEGVENDPVSELDCARWQDLQRVLKDDLCSVPLEVMRAKGWTEVKPGENDYDGCFRDWWLVEVRRTDGALELVTAASDVALTHAGIVKYSSRLTRLARTFFGPAKDTKISFVLQV